MNPISRWRWIVVVALAGSLAEAGMVTRRWGKAPKEGPTAKARQPRVKPPTAYVPKVKTAPRIDGDLSDAAWKAAALLRLEQSLDGSAGAAQRTEVRLSRDEQNLYIGVRCAEPLMSKLKASTAGHDGDVWGDDDIEIFLGPGGRYFHLVVNPRGATYDGRGKDRSWNSGMTAAVGKGVREWTAELSVPLKRMSGAEVPTEWIGNFVRGRRTTGALQESAWSPTYSDDSHVPQRFGKLFFKAPPEPEPDAPRPTVKKEQVTILPSAKGEGVVRFDLTGLPAGANIYRADLLLFRSAMVTGADEAALANIEVFPLSGEFKAGGAPKVSGGPLALRGPWFDRFDATAAVRKSVARRSRPSAATFYVKTCPYWNAEGSCLDVAYEGECGEVPPQPSNVKVLHRAGQTFITWKEPRPLITAEQVTWGQIKRQLAGPAREAGEYRIYAHSQPVTAGNIHQAELLGEADPLSGYNVNARNREYLIGQAMIASDQIGELARHYNGEISRWHMNSLRMDRYPVRRFVIDERAGELPVGTGLYVHQTGKAGRRHYAVVAVRDGVENTRDISPANAPRKPVSETVGAGVPVRQGKGLWGPYFDYPGTRWVYVQWCAPPLAPRCNMYFNWSVLVPPGAGDSSKSVVPGLPGAEKVPAELYFHRSGYSYAQPSKKMLLGSIQIAPHDYPGSGWYGFNDAWGTLKSFKQGTVNNHTQRRIIAFLEWAKKSFPIDPEQVISVGADGAAALALNFPEMFAYVRVTGFDASVLNPRSQDDYAAIWGPASAEIKDAAGRAEWAWAQLDELALSQQKDLPLFTCLGASWGRDKGYAKGDGRFYRAMQKAQQPLCACWGWNGARNLGNVSKYTARWRGHGLTRGSAVPAVWDPAWNHGGEQSGSAALGGANWKDLTDEPGKFAVTIVGGRGKFNLTPRRLRRFKVTPGERLRWQAVSLPGARSTTAPPKPQSGHVTADKRGGVTLKGLNCADGIGGLVVSITRGKP